MSTFSPLTLRDFEDAVADGTFAKLSEALDKLSPQGGNEPFMVGATCPHVIGWDENYMNTVAIGTLLEQEGATVAQFDIMPKNVISILMGTNKTPGLLTHREIINPITVGVKRSDSGELDVVGVVGGRHRLTALLTAYHYSGVDIKSAEFRRMLLPVFLVPYRPELVVSDNVSRSMPAIELDNIAVTEMGVDIADRKSIREGFKSGVVKPANRYLRLMALNFQKFAEPQDPEVVAIHEIANQLTSQTLAQAIQGAFKDFQEHSGIEPKTKAKAEFNRKLAHVDVLDHIFVHMLKALPDAVKRCRQMGITNFARNAASLGTAIEFVMRTVHGYQLPELPKEPKLEVDAETAAEVKPKKRVRKAKKSETPDQVPETAGMPH